MKPLRLDPYVVETLLPDLVGHDRAPSAFLVYLHLWARAGGRTGGRVTVSYRDIAVDTGLSRGAVQAAVGRLARRRLLEVTKASPTAVPEYRVLAPWRRPGE